MSPVRVSSIASVSKDISCRESITFTSNFITILLSFLCLLFYVHNHISLHYIHHEIQRRERRNGREERGRKRARERERKKNKRKLSIKDDRIKQLFKCLYVTHLQNCTVLCSLYNTTVCLTNLLIISSATRATSFSRFNTIIRTHTPIYICIIHEDTCSLADDCVSLAFATPLKMIIDNNKGYGRPHRPTSTSAHIAARRIVLLIVPLRL